MKIFTEKLYMMIKKLARYVLRHKSLNLIDGPSVKLLEKNSKVIWKKICFNG